MNSQKDIADSIRNIRLSLGLSQADLAKKLNVSSVQISYLEKEKSLPSKELLTNLLELADKNEQLDEILNLLEEARNERKYSHPVGDAFYKLIEKGDFSFNRLKKLLKNDPSNINYIYGMYILLKSQDKTKEAKKFLLESLSEIDSLSDRKFIEATYYEEDKDYPRAISLMTDAFTSHEKNNQINDKETFSTLIFRTATLYYKYGQFLYNASNKNENFNQQKELKNQSLKAFNDALQHYEKAIFIYPNPFYQLDYANTFLCLAYLEENKKENLLNYVEQIENALNLNHEKYIDNYINNNFDSEGIYSKSYVIVSISFLAKIYASLAQIENDKQIKSYLLDKGQKLLVYQFPLSLAPEDEHFYRFYWNYACFFSIKANIEFDQKRDYEKYLSLCYGGLKAAAFGNSKNKLKSFLIDINDNEDLIFYKKMREKELQKIVKDIKEEENENK